MSGFGFRVKPCCSFFEVTAQAYYKAKHTNSANYEKKQELMELVKHKRSLLPYCGGRKLLYMIRQDGYQGFGRDRFFRLLRENDLLIRRRKRYARTTNSNHFFRIHKNHLKNRIITTPGQALVSDITYIRLADKFAYLALTTDVFSRKIVGYDLSTSLCVEGALAAAKMSLKNITPAARIIHHSDRGIQYCCKDYTDLLVKNKITISMAEAGNPYENATAERINGILKMEFGLDHCFKSFSEAKKAVRQAIHLYNTARPHLSLGYATPQQVHSGFQHINRVEQKKKEAKKKMIIN